jgi:FtsP/CotA-like multicopper oxidase with cupredoxin domain
VSELANYRIALQLEFHREETVPMTMMKTAGRLAVATLVLALAVPVSAQLPFTPYGPLNLQGPTVADANYQPNYPYPGQCTTVVGDARFPNLPTCTLANAPSFACNLTNGVTTSNQTAGSWIPCDAITPFPAAGIAPLIATGQPKFVNEVLNPFAYTPNTAAYPGADYYELALHEAWGFQGLTGITNQAAGTGFAGTLFPDPTLVGGGAVPNGMQWTGLQCRKLGGGACLAPPGSSQPQVAPGAPVYTPVWGVGPYNAGTGLTSPWSANASFATWPSISIWATKGRPVVVKWINEFPNNHVFCPHPEAADWPCAIDRTFMGVKARIDPALATANVPPHGVNQFGSPQQPDNSWVTHFHGGEIPPSTDGFAEKWFGNLVTAAKYAGVAGNYVNPPFENPSDITLSRPAGANSDIYAYPMQQEEATVWFHDHTLGKTHHNVIAGPAGFIPVYDPAGHAAGGPYAWLNPVTAQNNLAALPYDLFLAIQDRSFNEDGTINFSNGLGQNVVPPPPAPVGYTPITNGVNPRVHPTWAPEYFGDIALVNGIAWPKRTTNAGWHRLRIVDGSDSRCWTIGFSTVIPAPGAKPTNNVPFYVLANDQGYLNVPVLAPGNSLTMCPGERYELLIDFTPYRAAGAVITMTNSAPAPFPAGITPFANKSPFADMNTVMQFVVQAGTVGPALTIPVAPPVTNPYVDLRAAVAPGGVPRMCAAGAGNGVFTSLAAAATPTGCVKAVRQVYLNERVDGTTLAPLGMQLNGVPFEYKVTETPREGTVEMWRFINLTVDAHPMHPHLVKHQIVSRQAFSVGQYKALLCGSTTCQPGTAPGGEMQAVPDVTPLLTGGAALVTNASVEGGWKDATQAPPGQVTNIIAWWGVNWSQSATPTAPPACGPAGSLNACTDNAVTPWTFEKVTRGPYVWHCHINSHEDSEMMRTSLVVPAPGVLP